MNKVGVGTVIPEGALVDDDESDENQKKRAYTMLTQNSSAQSMITDNDHNLGSKNPGVAIILDTTTDYASQNKLLSG